MRTIRTRLAGLACCTVALLLALPADAQWKWRDENGQTHYSDQPPPTSVPPARILREQDPAQPVTTAAGSSTTGATGQPMPAPSRARGMEQPGAPVQARPDSSANATAGADQRAGATAPKSWEDRALERRKLDAQRAETERKSQAQAEQAATLGRACEMLRTEARTLESGIRVARVNAQGEQEVMTEDERAGRLSAVRRELQSNCPIS